MAIDGVYRYNELIDNIVGGDFYRSLGMVLPYRSGKTEVRLETGTPTNEFGVYINDKFTGTVLSDAEGNVVFWRYLDLGDNEIILLDHLDGRQLKSYVTLRDYAIWLASYAEVLEYIDDNIQETQDDLSIENVTINGIEDHFGEAIRTYNNLGQDLDTYRNFIHELRLGYRNYGSRFRGLETAVAEFTQIPPFGYSRRMWGPNWFLDHSMAMNHRFKERSHSISTTGNITGVTPLGVEADVTPSALHRLYYTAGTNELNWGPFGITGPTIQAADGDLFIPGYPSTVAAYILGLAGTFNITIGVDDILYMDIDNHGLIAITITPGAAVPLATVVTDINNALVADVRYGAPYAAFASVYNSKLLLQCPLAPNSSIKIEHGVQNIAPIILGNKPGDFVFYPNIRNGVYINKIQGNPSVLGNADLEYEYDGSVTPVTRRLRWRSFGAVYSPWVSITQNGNYILTDSLSAQLHVNCITDLMDVLVAPWPATAVVNFSIGYNRTRNNLAQILGLWINCDTSLLPAAGVTIDTITVADDTNYGFDETPDNWWIETPPPSITTTIDTSDVIEGKPDPLDPNPAFKWIIEETVGGETALEVRSHVLNWPMPRPGPRGTNFPQRSRGMFYDYEGFEAKINGWFRSYGAGVATITLAFSFDNGTTWVGSGAFPIVVDTGGLGYEGATYAEFETIVPPDSVPPGSLDNGILVSVAIDKPGGNIKFSIDAMNVGINLISSSYLATVTQVRSRHRQYFGELVWLWSPHPLSLLEKEYLGLRHKKSNITIPLSGVEITHISETTPAGVGNIEYEYNSVGDTRRLRWETLGSTYGAWVSLVGNGSYILTSADGSTITVSITWSLLKILSGTPPAATTNRDVTITDTTVNQGHARRISAANSSIDLLDVTEYDSNNNPTNLFGAISEADFSVCTHVNTTISASDPFVYAYVYPTLLPVEDEQLSFTPVGPNWVATLTYASDQDQVNAILYEDGIAFPNDLWSFTAANQVTITSSYSASSVYTIDYGLIYQVTVPVMDLTGYNLIDHIIFADYFLWDRLDKEQGEYDATIPLFFNPNNGRATLVEQSTMNMSDSNINVEDGSNTYTLSQRYWRYLDSKTVEIDLSQLIAGATYFLSHKEKRVYGKSRLTEVFEHRSGINNAACLAASWNTIERNENIRNDHDFHQLRLSVTGIRDLRDFRIRSMTLKCLHAFGVNRWVPALTEPA